MSEVLFISEPPIALLVLHTHVGVLHYHKEDILKHTYRDESERVNVNLPQDEPGGSHRHKDVRHTISSLTAE